MIACAIVSAGVLSVNQAAEFLNLDPSRVRKLAKAGRIKADKVGRDWVIKQSELDRFAKIPRDMGAPTKAERRQRLRAHLGLLVDGQPDAGAR